jgi:hypothetical protein
MSSLSTFPVEILEWIASVLPAWTVGRLFCTGDRVLAAKLANGVKSLRLDWPHPCWCPWPSAFFRLFRHLESVSWNSGIISFYCPEMNLNLLPSSLTSLDISTEDVYCLFRAKNWKLDTMFPRLTSLEMAGQRLKAANLKNLPPTLTTLVVVAYSETLSKRDLFADLPRGLTTLEFWFKIKDYQEDGNELPPNLTSLTISELKSKFNWFKKIPHSVTKLDISAYAPLDWNYLPPALVELDLGYPSRINSPALSQLPKSIHNLRIWIEDDLKDYDMAELPRSLTSFEDYGGKLTHEGLQLAPPGLTDLSVDVYVTHPDMISFFHPESVRIRLITNEENGGNLIFLNPLPLPTTLRSLTVHYMTDELCMILPSQLQQLEFSAGNLTAQGAKIFPTLKLLQRFTTTIDAIQDDVVPYLRHIPSVSFEASSDLKRNAVRLTPNFIRLVLPSSTPNEQVHSSSDAPYDAKSLKLVSDLTYTDPDSQPLSTIRLEFGEFEDGHIFLPRSTFSAFAELKHLETLCIKSLSHNIECSWLSELPSSLRSLELSLLAKCPEPSELAALPPGLTRLDIEIRTGAKHHHYQSARKAPWTDQDLASLPRSLTYFRINCKLKRLTPALNEYTPPFLSEFRVIWDDFKHFQPPLTRFFGPNSKATYSTGDDDDDNDDYDNDDEADDDDEDDDDDDNDDNDDYEDDDDDSYASVTSNDNDHGSDS